MVSQLIGVLLAILGDMILQQEFICRGLDSLLPHYLIFVSNMPRVLLYHYYLFVRDIRQERIQSSLSPLLFQDRGPTALGPVSKRKYFLAFQMHHFLRVPNANLLLFFVNAVNGAAISEKFPTKHL